MSQRLLDAGQILTKSSQNKVALFATRHFGAKQIEDKRISRLPNSRDRCICCLPFKAA
jgi:hypothetical protein